MKHFTDRLRLVSLILKNCGSVTASGSLRKWVDNPDTGCVRRFPSEAKDVMGYTKLAGSKHVERLFHVLPACPGSA